MFGLVHRPPHDSRPTTLPHFIICSDATDQGNTTDSNRYSTIHSVTPSMPINESVIKAAHRLFLLLVLLSILLLAPWPQRYENSPGSLLEFISAHLSHNSRQSKHATTTSHNHHSSHKNTKDDDTIDSLFLQGLARGFYHVGIAIAVWFVGMCLLGGACRTYLCIEDIYNRRPYSVLPLFREESDDDYDDYDDYDDGIEDVEGDDEEENIGMREMSEGVQSENTVTQ